MVAIITSVYGRFEAKAPPKQRTPIPLQDTDRRSEQKSNSNCRDDRNRAARLVVRYNMPTECWFG
jgi:hypothetical protein